MIIVNFKKTFETTFNKRDMINIISKHILYVVFIYNLQNQKELKIHTLAMKRACRKLYHIKKLLYFISSIDIWSSFISIHTSTFFAFQKNNEILQAKEKMQRYLFEE